MENKNNVQYDVEIELKKMQKAIENNRAYGSFEVPDCKNKKEIMEKLQVKQLFENLNAYYLESKNKAEEIKKDKRFNSQYKVQALQDEKEKLQFEKNKTLMLAKVRLNFWRNAVKEVNEPIKTDQDILLDSINKNSLLLKLATIQTLENKPEYLLQDLAKEAYSYPDIRGLVEESFKDDVVINRTFIELEEAEKEPYREIDALLHNVDILESNTEWIVDDGFGETGEIHNMDKLDDVFGME